MAAGGLLPNKNNEVAHQMSKWAQKQRSCTPDVRMGAKTTELIQLA
jgi:hypothetical protein